MFLLLSSLLTLKDILFRGLSFALTSTLNMTCLLKLIYHHKICPFAKLLSNFYICNLLHLAYVFIFWYNYILLYGYVSQGLGTTEFTNLIG